jgi:hypothetical protein
MLNKYDYLIPQHFLINKYDIHGNKETAHDSAKSMILPSKVLL